MKPKIFVGNKTLNDEQIKGLGQGHKIIVKDVLRNGKKYTVFVRIEDGRIKKRFVPVTTSE